MNRIDMRSPTFSVLAVSLAIAACQEANIVNEKNCVSPANPDCAVQRFGVLIDEYSALDPIGRSGSRAGRELRDLIAAADEGVLRRLADLGVESARRDAPGRDYVVLSFVISALGQRPTEYGNSTLARLAGDAAVRIEYRLACHEKLRLAANQTFPAITRRPGVSRPISRSGFGVSRR